mgnify:FL=1
MNPEYNEMYKNSQPVADETDIYIFSDPQWTHEEHPLGLTYFNTDTNCAALLGMKYFGEHKKGTLTIAWRSQIVTDMLPAMVDRKNSD